MGLEQVRRDWTRLGSAEPLWAVCVDPDKRDGGWDDDEFLASGRSDAVLGNPLNSVGWLASTVAKFGVRLRKGDVILPGTAIRAMDAAPGDRFRADFAGLGSVSMEFC